MRYKIEVIEVLVFIDESSRWKGFSIIIDKPACSVPIQVVREYIKQGLRQFSQSSYVVGHCIYRIHACNKSKVGRGVILGCQQKAVSLSCGNIDRLCFSLLGIDTIHFHDSYVVALEPNVLASKSTHVDHAEEIGLSRLYRDRKVLGIIEENCLWDWFCSCWVGNTNEFRNPNLHFIMIPIRDRENKFLVNPIRIWKVWIRDDEWSSQSIWVLPLAV